MRLESESQVFIYYLHIAFQTVSFLLLSFQTRDLNFLKSRSLRPHLLFVVGCVRQQSRHMEHELVVLVSRVQGVSSSGIRCRKN